MRIRLLYGFGIFYLLYYTLMDHTLYRRFLEEYVRQAVKASDGSVRGVAEELGTIRVGGLLTLHKEEKQRALADARRAFDEHRHWPLEIILSHLGVGEAPAAPPGAAG
jgi:hypothetical protein